MRFQLVPGLLSQQRIECDDDHHKLVVNLYLVPLSATQYQLVVALLRQRQRWEEDTQAPLILSVQRLQQMARLPRRAAVKKHLWSASSRLAGQGLVIASIHSYGYAIFHASELVAPPASDRPHEEEGVVTRRELGTNVPSS